MDLNVFMKNYAHRVSGQYIEYDAKHSIIVVPLAGGRFQTVVGNLKKNELYNRELIIFSSKVCPYKADIKLNELLEQASFFNYARFVLNDGYLKIEAVDSVNDTSENVLAEKIEEVANLADQYEMKLIGSDIY